ncbi:hypothetical protein FHW69_001188 [Luteibacter sp. Sphag1AF]|nr:hypothetical protein [Luteibacter sp. Sphag1AF]
MRHDVARRLSADKASADRADTAVVNADDSVAISFDTMPGLRYAVSPLS